MKNNKMLATIIASLLLLVATPQSSASPFSDHNLDSSSIASGEYLAIDLGEIDAGVEIDVSFSSSEDIDGLLMSEEQYNSWTSGGTDFTREGSAISQKHELYTFTVLETGHYWYVLDNSDQNPGGASSGTEATVATGGISLIENRVYGPEIKTRAMVSPNNMIAFDLGYVEAGLVLDLGVTCEDRFYDSIDVFVVSDTHKSDFESGSDSWNKHASKLDTCYDTWSFEVEQSDSWSVYVDNGPRGEAGEGSEPIQVDVRLGHRSLLPTEITSNTRMIESGEAWEVELGDVSTGDTLSFFLNLNGLFDELDILIMESDQADLFLSGQTATVLGHPSLIGVDFFDAWDYRFPKAGSFSLILDNSAEPQGGSDAGMAVQAEISIIETTILSNWVGWHQSRHYVEDGSFVSFDMGQLSEGQEFGYSVSGNSHGTGFLASMNPFDVLVFEDSEYQNYVSGLESMHIDNQSTLNEWFFLPVDVVVSEPGHYWIVIDAADGPSTDSADANGAWTFDFTITSDMEISSPQAEDGYYEMIATNLGSNAQGNSNDDSGTDSGTDSSSDSDTQEEEVADIGVAKETSETPGLGLVPTILAISLVAISGIGRDERDE